MEGKITFLPGEVCQTSRLSWQPRQRCLAELAGVSRGHSTSRGYRLREGLNVKKGVQTMSSRRKQRQQKIPLGSYQSEEAVNLPGTAGAPSFLPAQIEEQSCRKWTMIMEQVVSKRNMKDAYDRVMRNKGAAGVDGVEVQNLKPYLWQHWERVKEELLTGTYKPQPVRRVEIPKPDGGVRLLGIPTVVDRLIQQSLLQVLNPIFDPTFSEFSYGFRPRRSARQAVTQARQYVRDGYRYAVDMDLSKFFDRVNHDILMVKIAKFIGDKRALKLIRAYLQAGVMVSGVVQATEEGTPQGGPLSPLLANIMLDELDKELGKRGHKFVRYADDFNIYVKSKRAGERVMKSVRNFVEGKLKLKVNEEKSKVDRPWKLKFLGFSFTNHKDTRIRIAQKTKQRFKDRVRELTSRRKSISMEDRIKNLNSYLRGWMGYFKLAETPSVFQGFDQWVRRRLRMCLLKQWKRPKTVRCELAKLGISPDWARNISGSRKGYWRLANTPQINKALGFRYWRTQGLFSLTSVFV